MDEVIATPARRWKLRFALLVASVVAIALLYEASLAFRTAAQRRERAREVATRNQIVHLLAKDEAVKARDLIASTRVGLEGRPFLRDLDDLNALARLWEAHLASRTVEWDSLARLLERVERSGKGELDARSLEWLASARDEDALGRALVIVQRSDFEHYDEAIALLDGIPRTSRVAEDARTYRHWIEADRDVRRAKAAYDQGDWEKAKRLLEGTLGVTDLGREARGSVTRRLETWGSVVEALNDGQALSSAGDDAAAVARLDDVLRLEPSSINRFHALAEGEKGSILERRRR